MKRTKKLIGLIVILAVLLAGYFAVMALVPKEDTNTATATDESADKATVDVLSLKAEDVDKIAWTYNGTPLCVVKGESGWLLADDQDFPLDSTCVSDMMSQLKDLKATRSFEAQDLAEYGLDTPKCIIIATGSDGTETVIKIGINNAITSEYYLSLGDSTTVYSVKSDVYDAFAKGLNDIVYCESMPEFGKPDTVTVENGGNRYVIRYKEKAGLAYSDRYTWYMDSDQGPLPLDNEKTEAFMSLLSGITISNCVAYKPDDLSQYGLDNPSSVDIAYTVKYDTPTGQKDASGTDIYETKSYSSSACLLIGTSTDDGYYVMFKDSNRVYLVAKDGPDAVTKVSYEILAPDEVCLMDYDTVTSMDVSANGTAHTLTFTYDENDKRMFTEGANTLSADLCQAFLDDIDALVTAGDADGTVPTGDPVLSITFHRNVAAYAEMPLNFYSYDNGYCLAEFNGNTMLVDRKAVDKLIKAYEDMA